MTNESIIADARAADLAKIRQARAMTEEARVLAGPRLFAGVCERMKEGLVDRYPGAGPEEIHRLLLRQLAVLSKLHGRRSPK